MTFVFRGKTTEETPRLVTGTGLLQAPKCSICCEGTFIPVEASTLSWSDGRKDINGRTIFTGDVVKGMTDTGVILYSEDMSAFCLCSVEAISPLSDDPYEELEVLGNIWEDPDLFDELFGDTEASADDLDALYALLDGIDLSGGDGFDPGEDEDEEEEDEEG